MSLFASPFFLKKFLLLNVCYFKTAECVDRVVGSVISFFFKQYSYYIVLISDHFFVSLIQTPQSAL